MVAWVGSSFGCGCNPPRLTCIPCPTACLPACPTACLPALLPACLPLRATSLPQVVWGYFKLACICCAANILAGTLVWVRSAHDDVRRGCAALFRGAGLRISRLGTAAGASAAPDAAAADGALSLPATADSVKDGSKGGSKLQEQEAAVERYLAGIQKYIDGRVAECAEAAALGSDGSEGGADATAVDAHTGLLSMPAGARDADLELLWAAMEISMKTVS